MLTIDFQSLALGSGQRLLDVGCGEGRHTLAAYLKSGVTAVGVDLGLADLETARGRIADMEAYNPQGEIEFLQGDATALPFPDNHSTLSSHFGQGPAVTHDKRNSAGHSLNSWQAKTFV